MAGNSGPIMFMGLAPMSSAITGWVMRFVPLAQLFAASGVMLVAIVVVASSTSRMRVVSDVHAGRA